MAFLLSSKNLFSYLLEKQLCTAADEALGDVEPKLAKNFNLLVGLESGRKILVKQEPHDRSGKSAGEFLREWRIYQFLHQFSALQAMQSWVPDVLHFDAEHSILVVDYLTDYRDLADFYGKENVFPPAIAASLGAMLATLHRLTFNQPTYQEFFTPAADEQTPLPTNLVKGLQRISPEIFGQVPDDGLKFYALYQRYDSLGAAIAELCEAYQPCCLAHNDLKLNNVLTPSQWETATASSSLLNQAVLQAAGVSQSVPLKLIDWERSSWGDPAFDLGMLIASYLSLWLGNLVVSKSIELEEALRLALIPLDQLQPSIAALSIAYLGHFPEMMQHRPDFLRRVLQFAGFALIQTILSMLQYQKTFDNSGICMLQVAKTLLCRPESSARTVFGLDLNELLRLAMIPTAIA